MIQIQHLTKRFAAAGATVVALNDINLEIQDGDIYGIIGMSGAGKSTLVRCINMLERPDEGKVIVNGREMMQLSPAELRDARREITHEDIPRTCRLMTMTAVLALVLSCAVKLPFTL